MGDFFVAGATCGRRDPRRLFTLFFWAFAPQGETTALPLKNPLAAYPCFATLNSLCFSRHSYKWGHGYKLALSYIKRSRQRSM